MVDTTAPEEDPESRHVRLLADVGAYTRALQLVAARVELPEPTAGLRYVPATGELIVPASAIADGSAEAFLRALRGMADD